MTTLTPFESAQVKIHQTAARMAISQETLNLVVDSEQFMAEARLAFQAGKRAESTQLLKMAREANALLNVLATSLAEQGISA